MHAIFAVAIHYDKNGGVNGGKEADQMWDLTTGKKSLKTKQNTYGWME